MTLSIVWRWEEKDLGFRFRDGKGARARELYQAGRPGEYYVVPASQRKLAKARLDELAAMVASPPTAHVVTNPWRDYGREWDWIATEGGICLNWAGCLDQEEIDRREDEGVQRAMELVAELVMRDEPVPITVWLIQQIHVELLGAIYPFAGGWRNVALHKGDGPTKWPMPPTGIQPVVDVFERDVLARSPVVVDDDRAVFLYASEVMNELLAIHPFREGNGRTAFLLGNLILMQNDMLPLTTYERREDEPCYFAACEAGRINREYQPLADLLAEWQARAVAAWEARHG